MKTRLLDAAYTILSQEGSSALTTRRVCEAVGVTMPTLYHHVSTRDKLVQAVYADTLQKFMSRKKELALTEDPLLDLRAGCELVLDFATRHKNVAVALRGRGLEDPEIHRPGFEHLKEKVARAYSAGVLPVSARDAMAMMLGSRSSSPRMRAGGGTLRAPPHGHRVSRPSRTHAPSCRRQPDSAAF
jgi:AcrR family transcriptional regulator